MAKDDLNKVIDKVIKNSGGKPNLDQIKIIIVADETQKATGKGK